MELGLKDSFDIAFIAGLFPPGSEGQVIKNSKISVEFAANSFQMKLAKGFIKNNVDNFKILNSMFINSFPRGYKKILINSSQFRLGDECIHENIGFVNLYYFRHFFKYLTIKPHIRKWVNKATDTDNIKVLIGYTALNPTLELFKYAKQLNKNIKTCLVVPDLPNFMTKKNKLFNVFLKNVSSKMEKYKDFIDSYVVLTEEMADELGIKKSYVVIEGIVGVEDEYKDSNLTTNIKIDNQKYNILYSGTLNKKYGVLNLIEAFKKIDDERYRLLICGRGDSENLIIEASKDDNRIQYFGTLKNSEVLELQKEARVLINPRQNNGDYTRFSFPSKNLEYMVSGRPVIAYKLDGIPDEYDDYLLYVGGNTIDDLKQMIIDVCSESKEKLDEIGRRTKDFAISNKNEYVQVKKILSMFGENYDA